MESDPLSVDLPDLPSEFQCSSKCTCRLHIEQMSEDRRLQTWERNQRESRQIQEYISNIIQRPKQELLMHPSSLQKYRLKQEHRTLLTYAQIPCRFDKLRGNPKWWNLPPKLHQLCDEKQEYWAHVNRLDRFIVSPMEYINIPKLAKQRSIMQRSEREYMMKTLDKFCLGKIQPHIPDLDDVVVVGVAKEILIPETKLSSICESVRSLQEGSTSTIPTQKEVLMPQGVKSKTLVYLRLNDQYVKSDSAGLIKTSVIFHPTPGKTTEMGYLMVQNRSTWALRIYFEETAKAKIFSSASNEDNTRKFYFDRNFRIIAPAETINIPFWFRSAKKGFFEQLVLMSVVPDLWYGKLSIQITLSGSLIDANTFEKCAEYEKMVQDRARSKQIIECLHQMLGAIPPKRTKIKAFTFNKAAIFEALNSVFDPIHDRPKYLYDKDIVDELEAFYDSVKLDQHPEFWSLSINDLRIVTKDREAFEKATTLSDDYNNIFEIIQKNKEQREEMRQHIETLLRGGKMDLRKALVATPKSQKSNAGGLKALKSSNKAIRTIGPERTDHPRSLTDNLEEIISKLQSPITSKDLHCQRFKVAYNLFCVYIDKISIEVQEMCQNYFSIKRPDPLEQYRNAFAVTYLNCDQMISCNMETERLFDYPALRGSPRPSWALEIPFDDFQARYDARINQKSEGVKKRGKSEAKIKTSKSMNSKDTRKSTSPFVKREKSVITEIEEPIIAEEEEEDIQAEEVISDWFFLVPYDKLDHYRNNIYLLFYQNLCELADDIELVFSMFPVDKLSPHEIQRLKFSQQKKLLLDEGLQLECINIKQKISELLTLGDVDKIGPGSSKSKLELHLASNALYKKKKREEIMPTSSSVWDIVKAYVPLRMKKVPIEEPVEEEERPPTPEEIITERMVQTSLCSNINVTFSDHLFPDKLKTLSCICCKGSGQGTVVKRVSSYHNSECFLGSSSCATSDTSSIDT